MKMTGGLPLADSLRSELGWVRGRSAPDVLAAPRKRDELMRRLGLSESVFRPSLAVEAGRQRTLTSDLRDASALSPTILRTDSVDEFKSWLGWADDTLLDWPGEPVRWELPAKPWPQRQVRSASELTPEEVAEIEKAGWVYLFGDSRLVRSYRQVIELCCAPFELAVYAVHQLRLQPGSTLTVQGAPALLLLDEVDIYPTARLVTYTICRAAIGRLEKHEANGTLGMGTGG